MSYKGYVVRVEQLRKHSNADRLQVATFFGNDTIVDLKVNVGDIGVYFPVDGQLSERFCQVNDLVRRKDENGNQCGGYMDPNKRNIKAIKLRGEKSDGLYLPITCLADFCPISDLKVGDTIDVPEIGAVTVEPNESIQEGAETAEVNNGVVLLPERAIFSEENMDNYNF